MTATDSALDTFYADVAAADLMPLWQQVGLMPPNPAHSPKAVPHLWRWKTLRALAERAGELITIDRGGDRRVLSMANPGLGGAPFATPTLWGAVQYLNGGEHAPGHRHTPGAIRFVLEGDGVYTTVDGDACDMHPGDLVLTPSWAWHDHNSAADTPMIWFDGLDMPTVIALDAVFFEPYPVEELQPVEGDHNRSARRFGGRGLLPDGARGTGRHSPLLVYRREETDRALTALLDDQGAPDAGLPMVSVEYVNPIDGRPALPTMGCHMARLVPGGRTAPVRRVGSEIWVVYAGEGESVIGGTRFRWSTGDAFVVPSWVPVEHEAHTPSDLFRIDDAPVMRALELYREETLAAPQPIRGEFEPAA
jgi:gentisate 1,2-dioxygenase